MGKIKKDIILFEMEEVFKHVTTSHHTEYVPLALQIEGNNNDIHPAESVTLDEGPIDTNLS